MAVHVNIDNFRAAETARMLDDSTAMMGGWNRWIRLREPTQVDQQPVIRMNRDTLYASYNADISQGGTLTLPDAGERYLTAMVVNEEHYINRVFSEPGTHELSRAELGSDFVQIATRIFVDPDDPDDVAAVNALQDELAIETGSARDFEHPDYDAQSLKVTRELLLQLGGGIRGTERMFGSKDDVEPTRHLIGTAVGWGGLPEREAVYYLETDPRDLGVYTMTLHDVPVDAFWSVTVYNRDGFMELNPHDSYSKNSVTAEPDADGSVVLTFAPEPAGKNHLWIMDGWNYALRLYKPRPEVIDKSWTPPEAQRTA